MKLMKMNTVKRIVMSMMVVALTSGMNVFTSQESRSVERFATATIVSGLVEKLSFWAAVVTIPFVVYKYHQYRKEKTVDRIDGRFCDCAANISEQAHNSSGCAKAQLVQQKKQAFQKTATVLKVSAGICVGSYILTRLLSVVMIGKALYNAKN